MLLIGVVRLKLEGFMKIRTRKVLKDRQKVRFQYDLYYSNIIPPTGEWGGGLLKK